MADEFHTDEKSLVEVITEKSFKKAKAWERIIKNVMDRTQLKQCHHEVGIKAKSGATGGAS